MPEIPEELFSGTEGAYIRLWMRSGCPQQRAAVRLYIRSFMLAADGFIGVRPSFNYRFAILPARLLYHTAVARAFRADVCALAEGGAGYAKAAGNYGAAPCIPASSGSTHQG
jgi:branched-chain amino acid aminotransferase